MKPATPSRSDEHDDPPATATALNERAAAWLMRRDAGIGAAEQRELQTWLEADARHAAAYAQLERTWATFDPTQRNGLGDVIMTGLTRRARARSRRRRAVMLTAAACLLAVCVTIGWRGRSGTGNSSARVAVEPVRKLPDGSIVELNTGAEIAVEFEAALRRVRLTRGEAHFRVEKDAARPFVVEAGSVQVRAVGTAFTVQLQAQTVEVVVAEGRVAVNRGSTDSGGHEAAEATYLDALNSVVMDLAPRPQEPMSVVTLTEPQLDERLAWRIPQLQFSGTQLGEAVALMNRHNRLQIRIDGAEVARLRIGGMFRSDNPEGFVRMMEGTFGLHAEAVSENEIVLRRR